MDVCVNFSMGYLSNEQCCPWWHWSSWMVLELHPFGRVEQMLSHSHLIVYMLSWSFGSQKIGYFIRNLYLAISVKHPGLSHYCCWNNNPAVEFKIPPRLLHFLFRACLPQLTTKRTYILTWWSCHRSFEQRWITFSYFSVTVANSHTHKYYLDHSWPKVHHLSCFLIARHI